MNERSKKPVIPSLSRDQPRSRINFGASKKLSHPELVEGSVQPSFPNFIWERLLPTAKLRFALTLYPFQSGEASKLCPDLPRFQPEQQLISLSDEGAIYAGENAWLMGLYALRDYRAWAQRLAAPALKPLAPRLCLLISHNRLALSNALFSQLRDVHHSPVRNAQGNPVCIV